MYILQNKLFRYILLRMYQWNTFELFILLLVFQSSYPQRRIRDGKVVSQDKKYAVYLLRAASAPHKYHGWLCGGAIITKDFILTSAACVQDVRHLYVIPGYKKYVSAKKLNEDKCVKEKRKRVVLTCVPKNYQFGFDKTELWAQVDIAVIKVESSFNFTDKTYETDCSYTPQPIDYNTAKDFPKPGDNVIALGWGHKEKFREHDRLIDMNQDTLQYASSKVLADEECMKHFEGNKALASQIASSMLCTLDAGNIDDKGQALRSGSRTTECITEEEKLSGAVGEMCDNKERTESPQDGLMVGNDAEFKNINGIDEQEVVVARRKLGSETEMVNISRNLNDKETDETLVLIKTTAVENETEKKTAGNMKETKAPENKSEATTAENKTETITAENKTETKILGNETDTKTAGNKTRSGDEKHTPGICQNDHGGPLVAWKDNKEILVGLATLYKLDNEQKCIGPYLFTKTSSDAAVTFINCIVEGESRRRSCEEPQRIGFEIVRRHLTWPEQ